jgi:predicted GTPase
VFFAPTDCVLPSYRIFYTEATSADAGVDIRVGRYADGVALDDDYYDISTSEVSEGIGHEGFFPTSTLTNQVIPAGYVVTVGTAGGKVGVGAARLVLGIIENAS